MLANVGTFDPVKGEVIQFHEEIYNAWLAKGAIATDSAKKMYRLYKKAGKTAVSTPAMTEQVVVAEKAEQVA